MIFDKHVHMNLPVCEYSPKCKSKPLKICLLRLLDSSYRMQYTAFTLALIICFEHFVESALVFMLSSFWAAQTSND